MTTYDEAMVPGYARWRTSHPQLLDALIAYGGHRRICSKTYAKGSGMIPRLDFAVTGPLSRLSRGDIRIPDRPQKRLYGDSKASFLRRISQNTSINGLMDQTERIAQKIVPGAKFLVLHWFNKPDANCSEFTILTATPEGVDYHGAYKVSVTATQESTGQKWVGRLEIMPESGEIIADLETIGGLSSFRRFCDIVP